LVIAVSKAARDNCGGIGLQASSASIFPNIFRSEIHAIEALLTRDNCGGIGPKPSRVLDSLENSIR
jgi:hypothetical protein